MMNVKKCAGFQIFLHIFLGILGGSKMDFPDYLNVDCSEDDADDAAELEAQDLLRRGGTRHRRDASHNVGQALHRK
jgi:hypothetical protein